MIAEVSTREKYHLLETDIAKDNVRLLISLNPTQSVSQAVKLLKGNVSRQFGLTFGDHLNAHGVRSVWGKGYFARTSGKVDLTQARKYVDLQAVHHGYRGEWTRALKFRNPEFKSPAFRLDHSLCMLDYHLVLATQNRLPLFDETLAPGLFEYIMAIGRKHKFAVDRIGLMPDHMHLIIESIPSVCIEDSVRAVLENTRCWMTRHYSGVLRQMDAWDVWQPSFYAGTVGEYSTAEVRQFLKMN